MVSGVYGSPDRISAFAAVEPSENERSGTFVWRQTRRRSRREALMDLMSDPGACSPGDRWLRHHYGRSEREWAKRESVGEAKSLHLEPKACVRMAGPRQIAQITTWWFKKLVAEGWQRRSGGSGRNKGQRLSPLNDTIPIHCDMAQFETDKTLNSVI